MREVQNRKLTTMEVTNKYNNHRPQWTLSPKRQRHHTHTHRHTHITHTPWCTKTSPVMHFRLQQHIWDEALKLVPNFTLCVITDTATSLLFSRHVKRDLSFLSWKKPTRHTNSEEQSNLHARTAENPQQWNNEETMKRHHTHKSRTHPDAPLCCLYDRQTWRMHPIIVPNRPDFQVSNLRSHCDRTYHACGHGLISTRATIIRMSQQDSSTKFRYITDL